MVSHVPSRISYEMLSRYFAFLFHYKKMTKPLFGLYGSCRERSVANDPAFSKRTSFCYNKTATHTVTRGSIWPCFQEVPKSKFLLYRYVYDEQQVQRRQRCFETSKKCFFNLIWKRLVPCWKMFELLYAKKLSDTWNKQHGLSSLTRVF